MNTKQSRRVSSNDETAPKSCASSIDWIPVTERLPDDDLTVMIATRVDGVWLGFHDGDDGWRGVDAAPCAVTHWAALPEGQT